MADSGGTEEKIEWKFNKAGIINRIYFLLLLIIMSPITFIVLYISEGSLDSLFKIFDIYITINIILYIILNLIMKYETPIFFHINNNKFMYKSFLKPRILYYNDILSTRFDKKDIDFHLKNDKSVYFTIGKKDVLNLEKILSKHNSIEQLKE